MCVSFESFVYEAILEVCGCVALKELYFDWQRKGEAAP